MFKPKIIYGLKIDDDLLRVVRFEKKGKTLTAVAVRQVDISGLVKPEGRRDKDRELGAGTTEDVFGFSEREEAAAAGSSQSANGATVDTLEDLGFNLDDDPEGGWDDAADEQDDEMISVVGELDRALHAFGDRKINLAFVIPTGSTSWFTLSIPPEVKTGKQKTAYIEDRLARVYNQQTPDPDTYKWVHTAENRVLIGSCPEGILLLEVLERLNFARPQTYFLRACVPEEIALMQYVKDEEKKSGRNQQKESGDEQEGSSILIDFGKNAARIIVIKDGMIQSAMPVIPRVSQVSAYANKVFSRMLMELEKGDVKFIRQIVINDAVGAEALLTDIFESAFISLPCRILQAGQHEAIEIGESATGIIPPAAAGAVLAAWGKPGKLTETMNFIPKHITDRQKVFRLQWHGVLLLICIAAVPVWVNSYYQSGKVSLEDAQREAALLQMQIIEARGIADSVREIESRNQQLAQQLRQMEDLGEGTRMWSTTLEMLHAGLPDILSTWITSLQFSNNVMVVEGTTLLRQNIPLVANLFYEAGVQQVTSVEIRERPFYNFRIVVNKITSDPKDFNPYIPPPPPLSSSQTNSIAEVGL